MKGQKMQISLPLQFPFTLVRMSQLQKSLGYRLRWDGFTSACNQLEMGRKRKV